MKNVSGLRTMYDLVEGNLHNLSSLGVPSDTYGKYIWHGSFFNQKKFRIVYI